ncbi:MAG TPA: signal peptidase II [Gammaproteobacteria bacterium]|nr:signal peptidase II [Gammaproteobacteria bacterium]
MLKYLFLSILILFIDQLTKWKMVKVVPLHDLVEVTPYFNLTMAHNYGAAFSFLADAGGWQRHFFIIFTIIIAIVLVMWLRRLGPYKQREAFAISLILGGALGNLVDRIIYGYVVDFIDIYVGDYHWPAFNVADMAIVAGAILLLVDSFKRQDDWIK